MTTYWGTSIKSYGIEYRCFRRSLVGRSWRPVCYRKVPLNEPQGPGQSEMAEKNLWTWRLLLPGSSRILRWPLEGKKTHKKELQLDFPHVVQGWAGFNRYRKINISINNLLQTLWYHALVGLTIHRVFCNGGTEGRDRDEKVRCEDRLLRGRLHTIDCWWPSLSQLNYSGQEESGQELRVLLWPAHLGFLALPPASSSVVLWGEGGVGR